MLMDLSLGLMAVLVGGTTYVDVQLVDACAAESYSVDERACSGADGAAFPSIQEAVDSMQPGDTLLVREGLYPEKVYIGTSGQPDQWLVIRNYPGEIPHLDGGHVLSHGIVATDIHYLRIEGFYLTGYQHKGIDLGWEGACTHVEIRYVIGDDNAQSAVALNNSDHTLIEHCIALRNGSWGASWSSGINLVEAKGPDNIVRGCVSFHNVDVSDTHSDGNGFIVDWSFSEGTARFRNNLAFMNGGAGIIITRSADAAVVNNTCYHNNLDDSSCGEICLSWDESCRGATVINNIGVMKPGGDQSFRMDDACQGCDIRNNYWHPDVEPDPPGFLDPDLCDFRLDSASPVIDTGVDIADLADDIGFDARCLKAVSSPQPYAWWLYEVDFDYIGSIGGVPACFRPGTRPQGQGIEPGAFEHAPGGQDSVPPAPPENLRVQ